MKISCDREVLLAAFQTAATMVAGRTSKAILQNVKLDATGETPCLIATDLEIGIRVELPGQQASVPGMALLSVGQFGSIVRESTDGVLEIETDGQGLRVRGERSKFRLPSPNPAEFPDFPLPKETHGYSISARLFKELIRRTIFSTETESSRYALGGILLEFEDQKVTAIATDGRRLARMEGPIARLGEPVATEAMTIVPARSMQLVERSLTDASVDVQLITRGNDFVVRTPQTTIVTRLVEGRFPRWRDVFPRRTQVVTIQLTAGPLLAAVRQAAIVANSESRGVDFVFGQGVLQLSGLAADVGESHVELPIAYDGDPIRLCLDHRFMTDFLRVLDAEKAFVLNIQDSDSAAVCETDDGYAYVVMPMAPDRAHGGR